MKKLIIIFILPLCILISCKEKERFVEPEFLLAQWVKATEKLNYKIYRKYEAFPKSEVVFREIYRETYYADPLIIKVEEFDEDKTYKDTKGNLFYKRNVMFECSEVYRKSKKYIRVVKGDVSLIRYVDYKKAKGGWLMWNRNIIRVN